VEADAHDIAKGEGSDWVLRSYHKLYDDISGELNLLVMSHTTTLPPVEADRQPDTRVVSLMGENASAAEVRHPLSLERNQLTYVTIVRLHRHCHSTLRIQLPSVLSTDNVVANAYRDFRAVKDLDLFEFLADGEIPACA
jgi:hypothetical protein